MKRLYLSLMLGFCVLLSACAKSSAAERVNEFVGTLNAAKELSFTALVRSEYDSKTVVFELEFTSDSEGCTVTVLEPELIAGLSARVAAGETALQFDDLILDTGELDSFGLTPMSALPTLIDALKTGFCDSAWEENGEIAAVLTATDSLSAQIRFDKYTMTPTHAELISEGAVKVFVDIERWNTI